MRQEVAADVRDRGFPVEDATPRAEDARLGAEVAQRRRAEERELICSVSADGSAPMTVIPAIQNVTSARVIAQPPWSTPPGR